MSAATRRQAADFASDCELFPGRPRARGARFQACDCGAPADRPMFGGGICDHCLDELVERVAARQALRGWGRRVEPSTTDPEIRSRFPAAYRNLRCTSASCSATWFGPPGEPCSWCIEALERMRRHQCDLLLHAELPDPDDARHDGAVRAWGERLARAVEAELISEHEAMTAWRRAGDERAA